MFGSVVGTTLKYSDSGPFIHSTPPPVASLKPNNAYAMCPARTGKKSTGTKSIKFINKIHTKTVKASGAIRGFFDDPKSD